MPTFQDFQQPGYWHVLLNHLPIYGLAVAALGLLIALMLRSRPAQVTALLLVLVTSLSAWPVAVTGERSYKALRSILDDAGADWLDEHLERAEKFVPVFYALAALAAAGLVLPRRWPRSATPLAIATLILAGSCFGFAVYIAYAGGKIRHPEFRHPLPPGHADESPPS